MTQIDFWPILVATVVAFAVSALWYSPILFGGEWMRLSGISEKEATPEAKRGMWKLYAAQLVITLVTFAVIGFLLAATSSQTVSDGVFLAFLLWIGFSLTSSLGEMLWKKTPLKLVLISEICTLVTWLVGGAIIAAWR